MVVVVIFYRIFVSVQVDNKEVFTFSDTVLHAYHWSDSKWKEADKQLVPSFYFE